MSWLIEIIAAALFAAAICGCGSPRVVCRANFQYAERPVAQAEVEVVWK